MQTHGSKRSPDGLYVAPWEPVFVKVLTPFEEFIHRQTTTGLILMITAVVAVILANSPLAESYQHLLHTPLNVSVGAWQLGLSLHHFVNDGLMALFFFVVGLELKREILVGELAQPRQAALPIVAAIGGMVVPALIYFAFNPDGDAVRGWGVPMATDIAFAVGVLALLANRVPKALITFLVALAIVDDIGAVIVIAVFYTDNLVPGALAVVLALTGLLLAFNRAGIRHPLPYFIVAVLLWYAMLQSGVHATLAGVIGAFTVPAYPKYDPSLFSTRVKKLIEDFDRSHRINGNIMTNQELFTLARTLENGAQRVSTPLQRLEHFWHLPVAFLVIPVFALGNAGIPFEFGNLGETLTHPVTMGAALGLVLGKVIGISGASWIALRLGLASLPAHTSFGQIAAVSLLGGIGFTMAIFIAELGFAGHPELLVLAKTGVIFASLFAGITGFLLLWVLGGRKGAR